MPASSFLRVSDLPLCPSPLDLQKDATDSLMLPPFLSFSATFIVLFPLIGIPVVIILILSLVALRYTNYYVYSNMLGNSGGIYALWSLRRFG